MTDIVQEILVKSIQLADQVIKAVDEAYLFKPESGEVKVKTEKLAALLRQAARASNDLYDWPTRRIISDTERALDKAVDLMLKCRRNGLKRVFNIIPTAAFRKMSSQLENSIGDLSWLLHVSALAEDRGEEYPLFAAVEPIMCLIWEQIAILYTGVLDDRSKAAASLVSLARDNDRFREIIIEEDGVVPLLKLLKEGKIEDRENAARAIGLLGRDEKSVEHMIHAGVSSVFAKILKEGPTKVQAVVAWAVSELADQYPKCQDLFAQSNIVRLLVGHLAFETVEEHSNNAIITSKTTSISQVLLAGSKNSNAQNNGGGDDDEKLGIVQTEGNKQSYDMHSMAMKDQLKQPTPNANGKQSHVINNHQQASLSMSDVNNKGRELEDPATKAYMKAIAARALRNLARGNPPICRGIIESRALLCFAVLLEKGPREIQFNSAMALMEITAVADQDSELRRAASKPKSPACKAVVDQLLIIIEQANSKLLVPCIMSIGNLARISRTTEMRTISPLVKLLYEREAEVTMEACIALTKFACKENYMHLDHSKAIIGAGGAKHLVQLVYFGEIGCSEICCHPFILHCSPCSRL